MLENNIKKQTELNFLVGKLGNLFSKHLGKMTKEEVTGICDRFPKIDNYLIYADENTLSKIGMTLILLKHGIRRPFRLETFSQYVDGYYASDYEIASHYKNTEVPLLFIYVPKSTPLLNKNEEYILPVFQNRNLNGLPTIVLCEIEEGMVRTQELSFMKKVNLINKTKIINNNDIPKYSR